jgi:rhodanese-related sulfurtransferase
MRQNKQSLFFTINTFIKTTLSLLMFLSFCAYSSQDISPDELLKMDKGERLLLDVRTIQEYSEAHIPNSVNIPVNEIETSLDRLSEFKDFPIVVYCRSGFRAGKAIKMLEENGFNKVFHLEGDMSGWQEDKRAVNTLK